MQALSSPVVASGWQVAYFDSHSRLPPSLPAELARVVGWHERRQREWLRGRAALRALIAQNRGLDPSAITISDGPGRPVCSQWPTLALALAHSAGHLLASAGSQAHGIDLERLDRPLRRPSALASKLFGREFQHCAEHDLLRAFVRLEALAKAQNLPLAALLGRHTLALVLGPRVDGWQLVELCLPSPWYGVLCARADRTTAPASVRLGAPG